MTPAVRTTEPLSLVDRLATLDWTEIARSLWDRGYAQTAPMLRADECEALTAMYDDDRRFRSRVDMARHRFGLGDYKYFANPLPVPVATLREHLYPGLARVANDWARALDGETQPALISNASSFPDANASHADVASPFPDTLDAFRARCAAAGQTKPTPLMLRYGVEGYNCLHQDVYGDVAFPLQAVVMLSRPGVDYDGGEFLLMEQRPRAQSAGEAILPAQGAVVLFTTRIRPVRGTRGFYRVNVRHGVSRVRRGTRFTLGIIFHDAK